MLTVLLAIPCFNTHFQGKASIAWDKFGTSPRQAINRALMNHLGRVGSDTGIRTRVSAVRGRRPGPLDDIALENRGRSGRVHDIYKFSHAPPPRASKLRPWKLRSLPEPKPMADPCNNDKSPAALITPCTSSFSRALPPHPLRNVPRRISSAP